MTEKGNLPHPAEVGDVDMVVTGKRGIHEKNIFKEIKGHCIIFINSRISELFGNAGICRYLG